MSAIRTVSVGSSKYRLKRAARWPMIVRESGRRGVERSGAPDRAVPPCRRAAVRRDDAAAIAG
ncbi:hypothetical protein BBJ41_21050 [Burkholderia stabilis]|nr:hypothetical protein BBJ41_21050 [Burkholderia stabilis]